MHKLYFAYGANTNQYEMQYRCPHAEPLGVVSINDHRLVFRGVADVEPIEGGIVRGALWSITKECEAALDIFEGFPTLYTKAYFHLNWSGRDRQVMLYIMRSDWGYSPPSEGYRDTIAEGYSQFGIKERQLTEAVAHAQRVGRAGTGPRRRWG